jgi:AcrR family transcriptional regulator
MRSESVPATRLQQARRDDIIKAAIEVIATDGYVAASVAAIAARAGTSKGTVLYHFRSRAAIEEAVVNALFSAGASYMGERIIPATGIRARLRAYLESNL